MGYHAVRSPSSAHRWTACTASIKAAYGLTDDGNDDARAGTCCHQISSECLERGTEDAADYLGRVMLFWTGADGTNGEVWSDEVDLMDYIFPAGERFGGPTVKVTQEMVDAVDTYVAFVRARRDAIGATMLVEQRVPIGHITLEPGGGGTSDAVLIAPPVLEVIDAKFGRHKIMAFDVLEDETIDMATGEIFPPKLRMNLQLALYALGTLYEQELLYEFTHVHAIIVQPFISHTSEFTCTVQELRQLGEWITSRARLIDTAPVFDPSEDNCHYCRASGRCAAQLDAVAKTVFGEFASLVDFDTAKPRAPVTNKLGSLYAALPMIDEWVTSVHRLVRRELDEGREVMRNDGKFYKLVAGRASARKWNDPAAALRKLAEIGVPEDKCYQPREVVSPTTVEELTKKKRKGPPPIITDVQWAEIQATLITQTPGEQNPVIALSTDPRPALPKNADGFEYADVPADIADLL